MHGPRRRGWTEEPKGDSLGRALVRPPDRRMAGLAGGAPPRRRERREGLHRRRKDVYPLGLRITVSVFGRVARLFRIADLDDQVEACRRVFESAARWTVVRGSDLEEGESEGLPVWSRHVGDPILAGNRTRRIDFALFMVHALENDALVHEAPAIVSRASPPALAHRGRRGEPQG